ncbi:hypothetical protein [Paenibacillus apiarius]|uniref:hypothetical protein n=1 Tax=Paenibacillus apiarius TaxID=46240 RepID=UPI003B3A8846
MPDKRKEEFDRRLRREFQQVKSMSIKNFELWSNSILSAGYATGIDHIVTAMEMHPKIYKPTLEAVLKKVDEIRSDWDNIDMFSKVEFAPEVKTAEEVIHELSAVEAKIYRTQENSIISILGKRFRVEALNE